MNTALKIDALHYTYRSDFLIKNYHALKGINLEVGCGEAFGFLGPNGAGKTTTIKCILGLVKPRSGSISIFGVDSRNSAARKQVGYLPEHPYFYDHLTVSELMQLYASLAGLGRGEIGLEVERALSRLKIDHKRKAAMRSLSKGQTQRVAMAQAILGKPRLLILNEPFSGLDPIGRKEFRDLLFEMKARGVTIFMASHILSDVEFICDRVSITVAGALRGVYETRAAQDLSDRGYEIIVSDITSAPAELIDRAEEWRLNERELQLKYSSRPLAEQALHYVLHKKLRLESYHPAYSKLEELFVKEVERG